MEKEEAQEMLYLIESAYPRMFQGQQEVVDARIRLWRDRLLEWNYKKSKKNLEHHIDTKVFEPKIAEIKPVEKFKDESWKEELKEIYGEH